MSKTQHSDKLTIVIPVYRLTHLDELLEDLAIQSDKDFSLVISSDGKFGAFTDRANLLISQLGARVIENSERIGASDPTMSWSRSVGFVEQGWIWLIGDDDRVSHRCVEQFNKVKGSIPQEVNLARFSVRILTKGGVVGNKRRRIQPLLPSDVFLRNRLLGGELSFASEYVFRSVAFRDAGGFVRFPYAWCSDDATWLRLASSFGIWEILDMDSLVLWREGDSNTSSKEIALREDFSSAEAMFLRWLLFEWQGKDLFQKRSWRLLLLYWYARKTAVKKYSTAQGWLILMGVRPQIRLSKLEILLAWVLAKGNQSAQYHLVKIRKLLP